MYVRKLRLFRMKYHIPLREIAVNCGFSTQRLNQIELGMCEISPVTKEKITHGLWTAVEARIRRSLELERDYHRTIPTMMDYVEEAYEQ